MNIDSPIGSLVKVLQQVKDSAARYKSKLSRSEAATRAVLIDPIIRVLGWDICNPEMVEFERFYKGTKIDYALNDPTGEVRFIVEAKAFDVNLSSDTILTKIVSYAFAHHIPNIYLTDGIIWKHYVLSDFNELKPVIHNINEEPLTEIAKYLVQNLDASLYWIEKPQLPTMKQIAITSEHKVIESIQKEETVPPLNDYVPENQPIGSSHSFISLTSLKGLAKGKPTPKSYRLPNGQIIKLTHWRDILFESVKFVLEYNNHLKLPIDDAAGRSIKLVDYRKMDNPGRIVKGKYLGRDVYIYLNYSANAVIANTLHILSKLPEDSQMVEPAIAD